MQKSFIKRLEGCLRFIEQGKNYAMDTSQQVGSIMFQSHARSNLRLLVLCLNGNGKLPLHLDSGASKKSTMHIQ